ncbi:MAG: ArnT family glycosyltransferase [Lachnospiraceae bacterium]
MFIKKLITQNNLMKLLKQIPDRPVANWLIMFVMATAIMMLLSRDSYLYLLGPRCDSAWFFMCGKAWMNGLVPYVDFADSKGPLLWLIYGVGYLLSHYDYHGVFWVSVVVYSFTFYFLFKTARIFLESRRQAILAVLMTSVFIFNPITHYDTQAEDFGMFFTALSLWQLCRILYAEHNERDERMAFFVFGISLAGTLLIKYNITAMCCIFPAIGLYYLIRERHSVWRPLLACVAGFVALVLPFLICFLIQGNFTAFIQEYFINTLQTIENMGIVYYNKVKTASLSIAIVLMVFPCSLILKKRRWMPMIVVVFYVIIIYLTATFAYYFSSLMLFTFFGAVFVVTLLHKRIGVLYVFSFFVIMLISARVFFVIHTSVSYEIMKEEEADTKLLFKDDIKPRIVIKGMERGYGVTAGSLPACKYWTIQNGHTSEMDKENVECVLKKDCDYVVLGSDDYRGSYTQEQFRDIIVDLGYRLVYTCYSGQEIYKAPNK